MGEGVVLGQTPEEGADYMCAHSERKDAADVASCLPWQVRPHALVAEGIIHL